MRFFRFLQIAALITLAAGAQPAMSAFWQWSKTAATNSGADPSINWAEGMSPSSVNDSARAMMARAAEWRDDISGSITTGGTSIAYTLTTNEGIASVPNDGQMLAFRASVTNGSAATMRVDAGTIYPIQSPAGTALPAGTLILGTPYRMQFNSASSAWVIEGLTGNPYAIPLGGLMAYTGTAVPNSNFVFPAGQCISTVTYAAYWAFLGSPASGTCAGGQFRIVDLAGRVPAGLDNMPGFGATNRMTSSILGCGAVFNTVGAVCGNQSQTLTLGQLPTGIASTGTATITGNSNGSDIVTSPNPTLAAGASGGAMFGFLTLPTVGQIAISGSGGTVVTSVNTSGTAHPIVQPTIGVTYLLRVI